MNWPSWSAFWAMNGYAPFVWGSYGVTLVAIVLELLAVFAGRKQHLRRLLRWRKLQVSTVEHDSPSSSSQP